MIAATEIGFVLMRVSKVVRLSDEDDFCEFVVLNEPDGDRHLVIQIGSAEAFALAASPVQFDETPLDLDRAPEHGEHTDALLESLCEVDPDEAKRLRQEGVV